MEVHRLKPMPADYDEAVFKEIYQKTEKLRNKLVYGIDHRRFGVEKEDIKSWFDCKLLYTFTKYYGTMSNEELKAHILKALEFFKCRILRKAYTAESEVMLSRVDISEVLDLSTPEEEEEGERISLAKGFLKEILSTEAYQLLSLQLDPPMFFTTKYRDNPKKIRGLTKADFAEYLGITPREIEKLQRQINAAIKEAREYLS